MDKKHWRDKRKLPTVSDNDHFQKQAEIALIREQCAADIMWEYVDHQHRINVSQIWFKSLFFGIVCVVFGAVVWFSLATVWKIAQKSEIAIADVGVAVTSMVSLISAVIVLPTKIAEYLFPAEGEKDITDFIVKMHESDTKTFNDRFDMVGSQKVKEEDDDNDFIRSQNAYENDDEVLQVRNQTRSEEEPDENPNTGNKEVEKEPKIEDADAELGENGNTGNKEVEKESKIEDANAELGENGNTENEEVE